MRQLDTDIGDPKRSFCNTNPDLLQIALGSDDTAVWDSFNVFVGINERCTSWLESRILQVAGLASRSLSQMRFYSQSVYFP